MAKKPSNWALDLNFSELDGVGAQAFHEFTRAADYLWKSPRFIEDEIQLEQEKLAAYFPICCNECADQAALELRSMRWKGESEKLFGTFRYLPANGNLFSLMSMYENFCMSLSKEMSEKSSADISDCRGNGLDRVFSYFRKCGLNLNNTKYFQQVDAIIKVRNCLYHAGWLLSWSRDQTAIKK